MRKETACNEIELLHRLRKDDEAAFTCIYNLFWKKLFFIAHKRVKTVDDSREIVQGVFIILWEKRKQLEINNLQAYLATMTRYAVYRYMANKKRYAEVSEQAARSISTQLNNHYDIEHRQMLDLLNNFSDTLPEKYRFIFLHHKLMDEPLEDVADKLGMSPRTAERYVTKVMAIVRDQCKKIVFSVFL